MAEGYNYHKTNTHGATQFPSVRPTGTSVFRESITDERKSQERLSESCTPSRDTDDTYSRRHSVSTNVINSPEIEKSEMGRNLSEDRFLTTKEKDVTYAINKMMLDEAISASIIDDIDIRLPIHDEGHAPYRPLSVPAKSTYHSLDSQMPLLPKWQEESKEYDMEMKASAHSQKDDVQPISFKSKMTLTGKDSLHEEHTKAKKVEDQPISPDIQNTLTETDGISKEYVKTTKDEGQPTFPKTEKTLREIHDIHDDCAYAQRVERISPTSQHHFIDHDEKEYTNTQYVSQRVSTQNKNLEFYQNKIKSGIFAGTTIEEMLEWKGNYWELEINHSYIQWLFPIPEGNGLNPYAQALQEHEAEAIRSDHVLNSRVLKAYEMMLDFYGMKLISPETGGVKRSKNWRDRFEHLSRSTHNNMRITRILKSLGQLGYQHFQLPWLTFILHEAIGEGTLTGLHESSVWHWINALTREEDRDHIIKTYEVLTGNPPEADLNESNGDEQSESSDHDSNIHEQIDYKQIDN